MLLRFLLASGPTQEPIDPVRFISNRSTGVMGRHLAEAIREKGHKLTWIECPNTVRTALELQKALKKELPKNDVLIMAAAVADFRPAVMRSSKETKENITSIRLKRNPDILRSLKTGKKKGQIFIGFGVESSDLVEKGYKKLLNKMLELIVIQKVTDKISPFGEKPVDVYLLDKKKNVENYRSVSKKKLAKLLVQRAEAAFTAQKA